MARPDGGNQQRFSEMKLADLLVLARNPSLDFETAELVARELTSRGLDISNLDLPKRNVPPAEVQSGTTDLGTGTRLPESSGGPTLPLPSRSAGLVNEPGEDHAARVNESEPSAVLEKKTGLNNEPRIAHSPKGKARWWHNRLDLAVTLLIAGAVLISNPEAFAQPAVSISLILSIVVCLVRAWMDVERQAANGEGEPKPISRRGFYRFSPIFLTVLLLAAGFNVVYSMLEYKPSPEKWPSTFTIFSQARSAEDNYPDLNEDIVAEMAMAYGFCYGQNLSLDLVNARFPELKPQVELARHKFNDRFSSSAGNIQRIFNQEGGDQAGDILDSIRSESRQVLHQQSITRSMAHEFLSQVEQRSQGEVPSPVLETLLRFHPDYAKNPLKEYLDDFARRYTSDGSGKALGLKLSIKFPMSWTDAEGERPHILRKLISQRNETAMVMIGIFDFPTEYEGTSYSELTENDQKEILDIGFNGVETVKNLPFENVIAHDEGFCTLAGQPAKWVECSGSIHASDDLWMAQRTVTFHILYRERHIQLDFIASAMGDTEHPPDPRPTLELFGPLFFQMATSFDLFDRYDDY